MACELLSGDDPEGGVSVDLFTPDKYDASFVGRGGDVLYDMHAASTNDTASKVPTVVYLKHESCLRAVNMF